MSRSSSTKETDLLTKKIESLPNLRLLCTRSPSHVERYGNQSPHNGGVYRSSKPDRLSSEDVANFKELGIKTIVDFRSADEYRKTDGLCLLDKEFSVYKVVLPKTGYKPGDDVETELIAKADQRKTDTSAGSTERRHFLINFFTSSYVVATIKRVPWYLIFIGFLHAVYDLLKQNKFRTFINFFIRNSVNKGGLVGQYKDVVDVSGPSVCAALKLVSDPENLPVLINCAHGKDRTGMLSAFILICLGMSEDYVAKEYSLSQKGLESIHHLMKADLVDRLSLKEDFLSARPDTMHELLDYVKQRFGSVQQYLVHIGFELADQRRLQENLRAYDNQEVALVSSGVADAKLEDVKLK